MNTHQPIKEQVVELMCAIAPQYHLTITCGKYTPEITCRNDLNKLLCLSNASIFQQRFKDGKSFLSGIAVQERSIAMDTFHFHILIANGEYVPSHERLDQVIAKHVNYFRKSKTKNTICEYQLQAYYNNGDNKLEHYLTKQFESSASKYDVALSNVGLLSAEGVCFG
jgi:hypothetical protein